MDTAVNKENVMKVLNNKKFQLGLVIILFLIILILSANIRLSNMNLLTDETSGKKIPLALDPYYFLRIAETKLANNGELPQYDDMRKPFDVGWHPEILPDSSIFIYKVLSIFDKDVTLQYAHVINPIIFFVLGLIAFFFLVYVLTNSRIAALLSSGFLAFIPTYLYRTMGGFSDHESIGMFAFFLLLLGFAISMKWLNKEKKGKNYFYKIIGFGLLTGFLTAFTIASWRGIANFVFMILPLSILVFWLIKRKELNKLKDIGLYYFIWMISSILITPLISGSSMVNVINGYFMSSNGLIGLVVLGFIIIDFIISSLNEKKIININKKYEVLYSLGILIVLGILFLVFTGELSLITSIFDKALNPFGSGRVGETVAENRSPTLENWQNQTGRAFFWIFLLGLGFIGSEISKRISKIKKRKYLFLGAWIIMIFGIIFSSHSALGSGALKKIIYFGSVLLFLGYSGWLYFKEKELKISPELIIIFSWMVFMLIAARGAIRLFFVITPLVCFSAGFAVIKLYEYAKGNKDEVIRVLLWVGFIVVVIMLVLQTIPVPFVGNSNFYGSSKGQAKQTGPSANSQWQSAMAWVRTNTSEESIFVHWWDYGYWVEYLGERATVADGGHFQGDERSHMIGRYVLTTPKPETALSFMKSNNASHLLIDPTDIGKYSAYSRIGSGPEMKDRYSWISTMVSDPSQIQETKNGTIRLYQGGTPVDEDILYEKNGSEVFLPAQKAGIAGIQLEVENEEFKQPMGIFGYNNKRYNVPLRYVYYNGQIMDFESGIEATAYVFPRVYQASQGYSIDNMGAAMYLSPRTMHSLVAELYLMDDAFNKYPTINLAHKEPDPTVNYFKMQGANLGDFVYFNGLRGPIKIWNTQNIPEDIIAHEEFTKRHPYSDSWEYGMLDDLQFRK